MSRKYRNIYENMPMILSKQKLTELYIDNAEKLEKWRYKNNPDYGGREVADNGDKKSLMLKSAAFFDLIY